ncbi:hypothetical protein SAMN05421837_104439 [Amycolatopsis pretoriensis]|uniref:Uncharacterized protein n=1 Tax=Amycolatopsis pretoriensis TaxID=218821 RepID=A0A1H5QSE6_9PSEU|nr:hypothetical protein [Amycolatopsis pretoriensis]SEF28969.1 hypothetical protein SAMN05421837_104439 [Amycolatopsis pretoriensis]
MPLQIDLPPGFAGLPVGADDRMNRGHAWTIAGNVASGTSVEEFGSYLMALVPAMRANGIRVFGKFAVGRRKGDVATLTLGVAQWPDAAPGNRDALVAALAEQYRGRHKHAVVQPVRLPIGPALVAISGGGFHLPERDVRTEIKAEYQIPLPDDRSVVILSVVAESEDAWPAVAEATAKVAWSLRAEEVR